MNYYSEKDIRDIVADVLRQAGHASAAPGAAPQQEHTVPVEVSARHVHLTQEAVEALFGKGAALTKKRDLSQPGEFLSGERVKLVTQKGEFSGVAVLGPVRKAVQVELSATDARALGVTAPVNLSGDLTGAGDVLIIGPAGCILQKQCCIVAKAHIHMTPEDAKRAGVTDGQSVRVRLNTARPVTLEDVLIRVKPNFSLAMHVDFDEANAALVANDTTGTILFR
ncbi:MAG: phosphate propanoyltransferase [Clostridia bacterium]|nr:phosphate propanoyltransferase [Clostridia bacterium]